MFPNVNLDYADDSFDTSKIDVNSYQVIVLDNQHINNHFNWNFNDETLNKKLTSFIQKIAKADIRLVYYGTSEHDGKIGQNSIWKSRRGKNTFSNLLSSLPDTIFKVLKNK